MVLPGDEVAVEEEYVASDGTFVKDGKIYASQFGRLILDDDECVARVECPNAPNVLKIGDIVYASIDDVRKTMAPATALCKEGSGRNISSSTVATIHVSKISPDYTNDVANEFRKGDLIRARVIGVTPSLQLTTKDEHLGVIRALCGTCKTEMTKRGKNVFCPKCKKSQPRKLADDYGDVKI
ncbi:putative RNA-binding protein (consists of S1 domain and a Zn-ribbon domain) [Thermoplasmatales archaeon BRNA1]|nr:putative RNA-binding protein (consists of S1 domain and a Zn-ribbon domain) [Thermoplasmatales archaeon BRNA1]